MTIQIDAAQRAALAQLLESRVGNVSSEIRHTDSPRVRQELRAERELLRSVLSQLEAVAA
jgi:hypothetical protein